MAIKQFSISIVIPYYKRKDLVDEILYEVNNQAKKTSLSTEVIIVDSNTDSESLNNDFIYIEVRKLNTVNTLSGKRNFGIKKAKGEVIICIDDDCLPKDGFLKIHYEANIVNDIPTIFSGQEIISPIKKKPECFFLFRTQNIFLADRKKNKTQYEKIFQSRAMHFSFSSKFKHIIPLFNENIKGYGWEDCIFFKECISAGIQILDCDSYIFHKLEETPKIFFHKQTLFGYWSYFAIFKLNFFDLQSNLILLGKIIFLIVNLMYPFIKIIYSILYKFNYFVSYRIGYYNYYIQKLVYYSSIILGFSSSLKDSKKYIYGNN